MRLNIWEFHKALKDDVDEFFHYMHSNHAMTYPVKTPPKKEVEDWMTAFLAFMEQHGKVLKNEEKAIHSVHPNVQ